jgi:hypothetical protein
MSTRPSADPRVGSHKASNRVFRQAPGNEEQNSVEEPVPSRTEKEAIDSLHAGAVEASAPSESSVHTDRKTKR